MNPVRSLPRAAIRRPGLTLVLSLAVVLAAAAAMPGIRIDTDPENMLPADQSDRLYYKEVKERFKVHDLLVLGLEAPAKEFTDDQLAAVVRISNGVRSLQGVVARAMEGPADSDRIDFDGEALNVGPVLSGGGNGSAGLGEALRLGADDPILGGRVIARDRGALALYIPLESKQAAHDVGRQAEALVDRELGPDFPRHLAGIPVAEETFGHEMFLEMAVTAPLAGALITLLLYLLFRRWSLVLPAMGVAMASVAVAMGALVGLGYTVHIMSSMIPVFLMPIAVLDAVHILSEYHDCHRAGATPSDTLRGVMDTLGPPMFYTTITSVAGFASLALAPIPPVQVFGAFVALGIAAAWVFTVTALPAGLVLLGAVPRGCEAVERREHDGPTAGLLAGLGRFAWGRARLVTAAAVLLVGLGLAGIARLNVNDNPVQWFRAGHPLRLADAFMNSRFAGTYMAYLVLEGPEDGAAAGLDFLAWLDAFQTKLERDPAVGDSLSVADVVRRANYVLLGKEAAQDRIPEDRVAIAQELFLVDTSGGGDTLEKLMDPDQRSALVWVQLRDGENLAMARVAAYAGDLLEKQPPPAGWTARWSGLTWINKVWQDRMVLGMGWAVLGGFGMVWVLVSLLFRSVGMGLLAMVPLTVAVVFAYGGVGWLGLDYDMPIAVCSSLSIGLAVDFAIHFLSRYRVGRAAGLAPAGAVQAIFGHPARAIVRNSAVITLGFTPLLISTLTPYMTVGLFFAALMAASTLATLVFLPALLGVFNGSEGT